MDNLQQKTVATDRIVFGEANMDDPQERALRFGEEAMELLRATGMKMEVVAQLMCHEYSKPKAGVLSQELAGVQSTLFSLADVHSIKLSHVTAMELWRVLDKRDECRAKHNAKPANLVAQRVSVA